MEEKKLNSAPEKVSYEQLENFAKQTSQQLREAYQRIRELEIGNLIERLSFLFKMLDKATFFSPAIIDKCVEEIVKIMEFEEQPNAEEEKCKSE